MESNGAVPSGTGVFYQAMPAVGADGRNIMKLIPVQMINGQCVQSQISKYKTNCAKPSPPIQMAKKATLAPSANEQCMIKQFSLINGLPNQVGVTERGFDSGSSLNTYPLQQQAINLMASFRKSITLPNQLPVTVKSPVLPSGQYLQIPPNAHVRTVPASELPPAIRKEIITSSVNSPMNSSSPTVLYVSPVKTMDQGITPPSDTQVRSLKLLSKSSDVTSSGLKAGSKLIAKDSQSHNSPLKWVIEEHDGSITPSLAPPNSPSMTSEILRAVAERENSNKAFESIAKETPVSQPSSSKSIQGRGNALVMCNGKVFFVAKKCKGERGKNGTSQTSHIRQNSKQIIILDESDEVIDLCDDDSQDDLSHDATSATVRMPAVKQLDEDNVIFVSYIPPKSVSSSKEHNIQNTQVYKKALEKKLEQKGIKSQDNVTGQKMVSSWGSTSSPINKNCPNLGTVHPCLITEEISSRQEGEPSQSKLVSTDKPCTNASGPEMQNIQSDDGGLKVNNQHSASSQQMESMDGDLEMENSLHDCNTTDSTNRPSGTCIQIVKESHNMESSTNPLPSWTSSPVYQKSCDRLLRQMFGITSDVKISLKRIDATKSGSVLKEPPQIESITKSSMEGLHKSIQESTCELKKKEHQESQDHSDLQKRNSDSCPIYAKRVKHQTDQDVSVDSENTADNLITDIGPLTCPNPKLKTKPLTTVSPQKNKFQSSPSPHKEMLCDVEFEPMFGYVEPIDEDFVSSTDENDIPNSQDVVSNPQTNTSVMDCLSRVCCVDPNTNPRRRGRTRKRTVCPCCITGTPIKDSAKNSRGKLEESDLAKQKDYVTPELDNKRKKLGRSRVEQASTKGGRMSAKALRKGEKASGRIHCLTTETKQSSKTYEDIPASESSSTTSMDSEEIKRVEQIKRLQDVLKEKEAALEMMRKSMG